MLSKAAHLAQMTDVLRRYPDAAEACVEAVAAIPEDSITEPAARAAYLWVLGEFGSRIQDAPYTLEAFTDGWSEEAPSVKLVGASDSWLLQLAAGATAVEQHLPAHADQSLGGWA
jgi:hypothetical protein